MSRLIFGDCLKVMKTLEDNSIDTVITDPPYGLKFMGKDWDRGIPGIPFWSEMLRVAKPGAIMLVFGGTRTYHRLACTIEDAGWQIRDCMMWMYGQGFPKSHDISKGIDKKAGKKRKVLGTSPFWRESKRNREKFGSMEVRGKNAGLITEPVTEEAKIWDSWGTGLKPAWEPIIVAMKPLEGTYAENALKWGVAGLNVDECRIGTDEVITNHSRGIESAKSKGKYGDSKAQKTYQTKGQKKGRFPANVILDEAAGRLLDERTGELKSGDLIGQSRVENKIYSSAGSTLGKPRYYKGDSGGASRFFYCAKASKAERNAGCEELEGYYQGKPEGGQRTYSDKCGNCGKKFIGENHCVCDNPITTKKLIRGNHHPTVKPLKLLEYLCRLTKTPTGGIVLDPFIGSGTTAVACIRTGRECVGIEKDEGYFQIASARIKREKSR